MLSRNPDIRVFFDTAQRDPALNWYAIADSAQHRALPGVLVDARHSARCLLGGYEDGPVAQHGPHLVALCSPVAEESKTWSWISLNARSKPCITVVASTLSFEALFHRLANCTEVVLPEAFEMFLGFWDPAILGTLIGQEDDLTLHITGPVLSLPQRSMLTSGIAAWWYWDRAGQMHSIAIREANNLALPTSILLSQEQVDELVEASVPDHLLYYLELNQPSLIADIPDMDRYQTVRKALTEARNLGLVKMQDLVNFACLCLIYKDRMQADPDIVKIWAQLKRGELNFKEAIRALP